MFDKAAERSFPDSVKSVASKRAFYECGADDRSYSLDPLLKKMESVAGAVVGEIVTSQRLDKLTDHGRQAIASFAAVQMLRTEAQRKQLKHVSDGIRDALLKIGANPDKVRGVEFLDDEQARAHSILSLPELARYLMPCFLEKTWILYATTQHYPFYISDNPIAMFNSNRDPLCGGIGLRVNGIEVYMPLSSTLSLAFLCKTHEQEIRSGYNRHRAIGAIVPDFAQRLLAAFDGRSPYLMDPGNVDHHNSIQTIYAERFVFSSRDNFDLAREMIRSNPNLKGGLRFGKTVIGTPSGE